MPNTIIDTQSGDAVEPGRVGRIASSSGSRLRYTVRHAVPSCRANPGIEASSVRSCPIAHQHARVVNKPSVGRSARLAR
jgi:hypothetical protein